MRRSVTIRAASVKIFCFNVSVSFTVNIRLCTCIMWGIAMFTSMTGHVRVIFKDARRP